jgi:hypothetical protein
MQRSRYYIYYLLGILFLLVSCREEEIIGEGTLRLKVTMDGDVTTSTVTRSTESLTDKLNENCQVQIRNSEGGLLRDYKKLDEVPETLQFLSGSYKVEVKAGLNVPATFDMPYYEGEAPFTIKSGSAETIDVNCAIQSTVVQIVYSDDVSETFKDAQVTVSTSTGTLTFDKAHPDVLGYYILPSGELELNWQIIASAQNGKTFNKSGTILQAERGVKYILILQRETTDSTEGGGILTIKVQEEPLRTISENIVISKNPDITGNNGLDLNKTLFLNVNETKELNISVRATTALEALTLSCEQFKDLGGLPLNSFNILGIADNLKEEIKVAGISCTSEYDVKKEIATANLTISPNFIRKFTDIEREVVIKLSARDANQKLKEEKLDITVSNAVALTTPIGLEDIWTYSATLRATLNLNLYQPSIEKLSFIYWTEEGNEDESLRTTIEVDNATGVKEDKIECRITDLKPKTKYYYQVKAQTQQTESEICTFITGGNSQLPNNSFDHWSQNGNAWMLYDSEVEYFWDSGNIGTMNDVPFNAGANTTTNDNGSVRMETHKLKVLSIIKLAAGNVFTGNFVETDISAQTAELSFGRPFTDRPQKMSFRYKYSPQTVGEDFSKEGYITKGETDIAYIYIALINGSPFKIKPTDYMFNKNDARVIAYAEFSTNETVNEFTEKEITLEYSNKTVKPTHILVVATSSKYGDYFAGAAGSVLWLDDVELVYE